MTVNWSRAFWWIFFAFMLYAVDVFFMAGCSKPLVYANGEKIQHDEDSVIDRDMVPEEKER